MFIYSKSHQYKYLLYMENLVWPISMYSIVTNFFLSLAGKCGNNCLIFTKNYLAWGSGGIGRMLVFLVIQSYLYFAILVLIESGLLRKIWYFLAARRTYKPILSVSREASIHSLVLEDDDVAKGEENKLLPRAWVIGKHPCQLTHCPLVDVVVILKVWFSHIS